MAAVQVLIQASLKNLSMSDINKELVISLLPAKQCWQIWSFSCENQGCGSASLKWRGLGLLYSFYDLH